MPAGRVADRRGVIVTHSDEIITIVVDVVDAAIVRHLYTPKRFCSFGVAVKLG